MEHILNIIFLVCLIYMLVKTAYKYNLDLLYDKYVLTIHNKTLIKILPENFCLQCAVTQSSLIASTIIVLLQRLPLYNIFMYMIIVASLTLMILNKEQNDKSTPY